MPLFVLLSMSLSMGSTAVVGTLASLQKKALAGDVVAHALLPGITVAFLIAKTKSYIWLVLGGFTSGMLALWWLDWLISFTLLKSNGAMAVVLSIFFGIGAIFLSHIQHVGLEEQAGIERFLLGNVASLMDADFNIFMLLALIITMGIAGFFTIWRFLLFDGVYAHTIGWPVVMLHSFLRILTVFTIVLGVHAVGIVLMTATLVIPVVAARAWTDRLDLLLLLSAGISMAAGVVGFYLTLAYPIPTGPCAVLLLSFFACCSLLFSPYKGWFAGYLRRRAYKKHIHEENVLKLLYELAYIHSTCDHSSYTTQACLRFRPEVRHYWRRAIKKLTAKGQVRWTQGGWQLTSSGKDRGATIYRRHLLWEEYLATHLHVPPERLHDDAEGMEHVINAQVEDLLRQTIKTTDTEGTH